MEITNLPCQCCSSTSNITYWVNINVSVPAEQHIGSEEKIGYSMIGYYCDNCRGFIEPRVMKLYEESKKKKLGKLQYYMRKFSAFAGRR